jgi:hypothetical protein
MSLKRHPVKLVRSVKAPQWPTYTGVSTFVGTSPSGRATIYVDPTLGAPVLANGKGLLADADRVLVMNDQIFGTTGGKVEVIIFAIGGATDGTGGADHNACTYADGGAIEVCAAFGTNGIVSALFEAELSECSMNNDLCGLSTGEALSRWCAETIAPGTLADFVSAPIWAEGGMQNFVDKTDPTDGNYDSIGCGMAFISWLMSMGHPLSKIAPAMVGSGDSGTLAGLYHILGVGTATDAWSAFQSAIAKLGGAAAIISDDPFMGAAPIPVPAPVPTPTPVPAPTPAPQPKPQPSAVVMAGQIIAAIITDLATGKTETQLVADITDVIETMGTPAGFRNERRK